MKTLAIIIMLLVSCPSLAQTQRDWGVGIRWTTSINRGNAFSLDALRRYNDRWQLEYNAFYGFLRKNETVSTYKTYEKKDVFGINVGARFTVIKSGSIKPYILVSGGGAHEKNEKVYSYTPYRGEDSHWYAIYSARLGTEFVLYQSLWSIDVNGGVLGRMGLETSDVGFSSEMFTIGILRRLRKE